MVWGKGKGHRHELGICGLVVFDLPQKGLGREWLG